METKIIATKELNGDKYRLLRKEDELTLQKYIVEWKEWSTYMCIGEPEGILKLILLDCIDFLPPLTDIENKNEYE